jgi:hypothetical protein
VRTNAQHGLRGAARVAYTDIDFNHTSGDTPAMTRTPTTSVTAIAIAARAFAGAFSFGAQFSGRLPEAPLPRP